MTMKEVIVLESSSPVPESTGDSYSNRCERIKACIYSYLDKNPRLSLQSVEDKTGVPSSTLRRIMSLKGNPQPESVIKIYQSLGFDQDLFKYLQDFHPEIAKLTISQNRHNQEYSYVSESDRELFTSEDYFAILNLAYTSAGTTELEVLEEFGKKGVERLTELLEKEIIKKDNSGRYSGKIENYKLSFVDTKRRIELALRYYKLNEAGSINNWMSFQTESINDEGLSALKKLHQQQFNDRKELIFNNSKYRGDHKVFSATVSSTFLTYKKCLGNFNEK